MEQLGATRADWILLSGKEIEVLGRACRRIREAGRSAGNSPRIAWSAYLGWEEAMIEEIRPHFTYIATDMPADLRRAAGIDDDTATRIQAIMLKEGMEAAARLLPDEAVRRFAVVGTRDRAVEEIGRIREEARPDMFLLPVNDYTRAGEFVRAASAVLAEAGFGRSQ